MKSAGNRFLTLSTKLMLSVVVVVALSALLVANGLGRAARGRLIEAKATAASMLSDLLAESLAPAVDFGDNDAVSTQLQHLQNNRDLTYAGVWGRTGDEPLAEVGHRRRGRGRPDARSLLEIGTERIAVARILKDPRGEVVGAMLDEFTLAPENARIDETRRQIFRYSLILALGVSAVVFGVMRLQVIRPLHRLIAAADQLGTGGRATVEVKSGDEIGALGHAFNTMAAAILDRENRLAKANGELKQLLDNMRQAIVVFGREGKVEGFRSRQAEQLFSASALERGGVRSLLYPDAQDDVEAAAFAEWQEAAFELPSDAWQETIELAPSQVVLQKGSDAERVLSLEFIPLTEGKSIKQVMLLATDVSDKLRLERMVRKQDEQHTRQLAAMRRLLAGGGHLLVAMLDGSRARIELMKQHLAGESLDRPTLENSFRQIHTIKGEARAFDLDQLEQSALLLEDYLALLRSRFQQHDSPPLEEDMAILHDRLAAVELAVGAAGTLLMQASPIGAAILEQVTVRRPDLHRVLELAGDSASELGLAVRRLAARPFGEALLYLTEAVPSWGQRYGKEIALEVNGREVRVPLSLASVLPSVMTHLARNAVAHGIETPAERRSLGKPAGGELRVSARELGEGLEILFEDDGRGLDREKIRARAEELGLRGRDEELVFAAGLSTSGETMLSGRGVGLGAVRQDLASVGYSIELLPAKVGAAFRIFVAACGKTS
jgi:HPt (histidine-containing phosphotransfer) domain-containing protein/HAMP domain-containing protein